MKNSDNFQPTIETEMRIKSFYELNLDTFSNLLGTVIREMKSIFIKTSHPTFFLNISWNMLMLLNNE